MFFFKRDLYLLQQAQPHTTPTQAHGKSRERKCNQQSPAHNPRAIRTQTRRNAGGMGAGRTHNEGLSTKGKHATNQEVGGVLVLSAWVLFGVVFVSVFVVAVTCES